LFIVVTNDDGIYSEGISKLAKALNKIAKVTIVAPDRERSATGHAITVHHPLRVTPVKLKENDEIESFMVNGTPSDCVKLAVEAVFDTPPDLIFSGINRGPNLGTDVIYSGTVSAAIEGAILGVPAVAISVAEFETPLYDSAAAFATKLAKRILETGLSKNTILNVNVPSIPVNDINGVAVTHLGYRRYRNTFEKRLDPRGKVYYWMAGEVVEDPIDINSDIGAIKNNMISITPVHFNLTKFDLINEIKQWNL
jgi:5'-nucleotidase